VDRAFTILEFLGESPRRWNISELSRRLGIPKSTTHILMVTLERRGYIVREQGHRNYTAALRFYGKACLPGRRLSLPDRALPFMEKMARESGLTSHLALLDEGQALYAQKVSGPGSIRFDTDIGKRSNAHCTAVGKVLLAHSNGPAVDDLLSRARLMRHTFNTISSGNQLRAELSHVRRVGFAFDDQEEELDVRCLAVPVFDNNGRFMASLGLTGTINQIHEENFNALIHAARTCANAIGCSPPGRRRRLLTSRCGYPLRSNTGTFMVSPFFSADWCATMPGTLIARAS
jgi:DNA-binding IclR family transcriptional regulator